MNATPASPSRSLRFFAAAVKWSLWLLLAASLLLALAWGALHGWIVPRIGEFRAELEIRASRVLGVPVRIGNITARSEGLVPSFELQDVVLLDPLGREALRLPLVVGALSPRSLWNLSFVQLHIHQPRLDIRRAADGRIFVAGLDLSRGSDNQGRVADWFFRQPEFIVQGGTLRWTDEMRGAPPLELQQVDFVARNSPRRHALRLEATPPPEWGQRFSLAGMFRQPLLSMHPGRWQQWAGELHADFAAVDLSQLRRHADIGFAIASGRGRLRAWADVAHGQLTGGVADVVLTEVSATLAPELAPLVLQSVSGRLGGKRLAGGFELKTQDLQFVTEEGLRWPGGNVALVWTGGHGAEALPQGELRADRLDLAALSQVASHLPLGTTTHAALQAYAPQGLVETLHARWQGPLGAMRKYEARGRASRLKVAAQADPEGRAGRPGVRGAAIDFDFTQAGGKARLAIADGALEFPGVFEQPVLPLDMLGADLQWQVNGEELRAAVSNLKFANTDTEGEGQGNWRTGATKNGGARFPGVLDLQASLGRADGARVWRYLPQGVGQAARDYVRESVVSGVATGARFRVKGELAKFPFRDPKDGEFLVTAQVKDVHFAYAPRPAAPGAGAWPALTQLAGELVFKGGGMQVNGATGRLAGGTRMQVKASARIPDFQATEVAVRGQLRGPLSEALAIVNGSPLNGMANGALARSTGTGNADVDLQLLLPVGEIARSQVQGTVTLPGNDLQITPDSPGLARARGSVLFSEKGFQLAGVQARALGGEVRIEGGTRPAGSADGPTIQLRAQGTVTAEGLRQARELGLAARLARDFAGSTGYQLTLGLRRGQPELLVTSNLQGMALNLPAPLNKTAEAVLPLRYENALTRESLAATGPQQRLQELLSVELGRLGGLSFVRELGGAEPQVLRGAIGIGLAPGESVLMPDEGVTANIQLATLDVDAWNDTLARLTAPEAVPAGATPPAADDNAPGSAYLPGVVAVRARQVVLEGRRLNNVVMGSSRDGRTWRVNVSADELDGYLEYRAPQNAGAGRLHARLARLSFAASTAREVEALLEQQPSSIPALDVVVDEFELRGRRLGRLEIDAVNRGAGTVAREGGIREWRLNKLSLTTPEALFTASGNWAELNAQPAPAGGPRPVARAGERRRTAMKFRLEIGDAGELLNRFGMKDVVRRGRGAMEGTVAWLGSPLALDYPTLSGSFNVGLESGQFLKADAGLAKLLGVLSLQSLPRRLALDFRDVFTEGFSFDFVRGDIVIDQGIAATNNLQMKGVNAAVLMDGKADIARETQDVKVVVVPEINAGTASLVATAINPALGLATFLAQLALRQPLMRAATQEFHIDGTWADPRVTRVPRTPVPAPARADLGRRWRRGPAPMTGHQEQP